MLEDYEYDDIGEVKSYTRKNLREFFLTWTNSLKQNEVLS